MRRNRDQGGCGAGRPPVPGKPEHARPRLVRRLAGAQAAAARGSEICQTVPALSCLRRLTSRPSSTRRGLANGIAGAAGCLLAHRRGGYRGIVQNRPLSKLGGRRSIRLAGVRARVHADPRVGTRALPIPAIHALAASVAFDLRVWNERKTGMVARPEPAPRDLEAAATL